MKNHLYLYPNLGIARKAKCTQRELAEYLGITQQEISRYESGEVKASVNYLCDLADYCGVTVDYLLGREPKERALLQEDENALLFLFAQLTPENKVRLTERAETLLDLQNK